MKIYSLIPENLYRKLAQETNLNTFFRELFSKIDSIEEYSDLTQKANKIRDGFFEFQPLMIKNLRKDLIGNLPLIFVRDLSKSSGAKFLRWRNMANNKSGQVAWENIITDHQYPEEVRQSLIQVEKERVALNMQISILSYILRQTAECHKKIEEIEKLANKE